MAWYFIWETACEALHNGALEFAPDQIEARVLLPLIGFRFSIFATPFSLEHVTRNGRQMLLSCCPAHIISELREIPSINPGIV